MPFLKALMPLAMSPISSEILPRPNTSSTTTSTMIQCQILKPPMNVPPARPQTRTHSGQQQEGGPLAVNADCRGLTPLSVETCRRRLGRLVRFGGRLFVRLCFRREAVAEELFLERFLVLAERRVVTRRRHAEARRQPAFEEARTLQLLNARQVVDRLKTEV